MAYEIEVERDEPEITHRVALAVRDDAAQADLCDCPPCLRAYAQQYERAAMVVSARRGYEIEVVRVRDYDGPEAAAVVCDRDCEGECDDLWQAIHDACTWTPAPDCERDEPESTEEA